MKRIPLMILLLSAAAFAMGCSKEETTTQQLDNVQVKTEEAARDMKDYTYAQKAEFTEKMQSQLAEINKDMDQLAAKSATESTWDDVKAGTRNAYESFKVSFQQARQWVSEKIAP